jgi:hypothetical protein
MKKENACFRQCDDDNDVFIVSLSLSLIFLLIYSKNQGDSSHTALLLMIESVFNNKRQERKSELIDMKQSLHCHIERARELKLCNNIKSKSHAHNYIDLNKYLTILVALYLFNASFRSF